MAVQIGLSTVEISWTEPRVPPANGYHITTTPSTESATVLSSPRTITISTPGVYTIHVMSLSQHLPGMTASTQEITVRGQNQTILVLTTKNTFMQGWIQGKFFEFLGTTPSSDYFMYTIKLWFYSGLHYKNYPFQNPGSA